MKKETFVIIVIILSVFSMSCDNTTTTNAPIDSSLLIGSWIDTSSAKLYDAFGNIDTIFKNGKYDFFIDNTYTTENTGLPIYGVPCNGNWSYNEENNLLSFSPYDSLISVYSDVYLNKTWEILSLDNDNIEVNYRVFRDTKVIDNPVTGFKDTIQAIDLTTYKKLKRIE